MIKYRVSREKSWVNFYAVSKPICRFFFCDEKVTKVVFDVNYNGYVMIKPKKYFYKFLYNRRNLGIRYGDEKI